MHQESFLGPDIVPHVRVEGGVLLDRRLDLKVLHLGDFFSDLILLGHMRNRKWLTWA
jgi:hypothetical protein